MSGRLNALLQGIFSPETPVYQGREQILSQFESLGGNCEFGLAQRYSGLEPLGLFRFTSSELPELIRGLDTDFADYGRMGDLELFDGPEGHIFCRSRSFSYTYNTLRLSAATDFEAALAQEYQKVDYLKRRFLEELREGNKVFVRSGNPSGDSVGILVQALRRHGPARLLWVSEAGGAHAACDARQIADGVVEGFMERSRRFDIAASVPLRDWIDLCGRAYALLHGEANPKLEDPEPLDLSNGLPREPVRHEAGPEGRIVAARVARDLTTSAMHTFSAWVWLTKDFDGVRVGADFRPIRYGYQEADPSIREQWQLVWASCKPRKRDKEVEILLICETAVNQALWSADWRLETGPLPSDRAPPAPPQPAR
ncbi:hypothetical protein ASF49_22525 [Methylobacterium sp. Leaf104]|uniref:hypothetical protein n=1 Tax=Methylobacterium TaxID=407 RepID=UPI00070134B9|nr:MULTISPECIES: hypothetical protein [Methylobacterium]KQP35177.1 hypothetical protein ASF49_22525 [Methylobacterium sp. Leaf104]MCI9882892.1 hypothetical protein [Methylobacterium goesingense]